MNIHGCPCAIVGVREQHSAASSRLTPCGVKLRPRSWQQEPFPYLLSHLFHRSPGRSYKEVLILTVWLVGVSKLIFVRGHHSWGTCTACSPRVEPETLVGSWLHLCGSEHYGMSTSFCSSLGICSPWSILLLLLFRGGRDQLPWLRSYLSFPVHGVPISLRGPAPL